MIDLYGPFTDISNDWFTNLFSSWMMLGCCDFSTISTFYRGLTNFRRDKTPIFVIFAATWVILCIFACLGAAIFDKFYRVKQMSPLPYQILMLSAPSRKEHR